MLTSLLLFILACFIAIGFFINFSSFARRVFCFAVGLYVAVLLTPLVLPTVASVLNTLLPIVFIRVIVVLAIFLGANLLVKKIWEKSTARLNANNLNRATSRPATNMLFVSLFNASLGFLLFVMLLLSYAMTVDYKVFSPIVSQETYYQPVANAFSSLLFGKTPKSDYIVKIKPITKAIASEKPEPAHTQDYNEYEQETARSDSRRNEVTSAIQPRKKKGSIDNTGKPAAKVPTDEAEEKFELPELNLNQEDVEALQEVVTDEVKHLLNENPEELKRALADVLTEEKGEELSAIIDTHIREGKQINDLMEKIELYMGDPKNLSPEFKESLPDLLREMDFVSD